VIADPTRLENMKYQIELLEKQTKRKEQLLNVQQSQMDVRETVAASEEINMLYL
jgi:hypothetical protein